MFIKKVNEFRHLGFAAAGLPLVHTNSVVKKNPQKSLLFTPRPPTGLEGLDSGPFQISFLAPGTGALEMMPPG